MNSQLMCYLRNLIAIDNRFVVYRFLRMIIVVILTFININIVVIFGKIFNITDIAIKLEITISVIAVILVLNILINILDLKNQYVMNLIHLKIESIFITYNKKFNYEDYEDKKVLDEIGALKQYISSMASQIITPIEVIITSIIKLFVVFGTITIILSTNLFLLVLIVISTFINGVLEQKNVKLAIKFQKGFMASYQHSFFAMFDFGEKLQYAKELRTSYAPQILIKMFDKVLDRCYEDRMQWILKGMLISFAQIMMLRIENIIIYILLAVMYYKGQITIEQFSVIYIAVNTMIENVNMINNSLNKVRVMDEVTTEINKMFTYKNNENVETNFEIVESVNFTELDFCYPHAKLKTLNNLSGCINLKQNTAIIGENGEGKSTLIKVLLGLYSPTNGSIEGSENLYKKCAIIMQDEIIPAITVREFLNDSSNRTITKVFEQVNLTIDSSKYDNLLGKDFSEEGILLSGGETQKLLIARALLEGKEVLVFDEPTSNLDPLAHEEIMEIIDSQTKFHKIMITHQLTSVQNYDQIILLQDHTINQIGTFEQLLASNNQFQKLYKASKKLYRSI